MQPVPLTLLEEYTAPSLPITKPTQPKGELMQLAMNISNAMSKGPINVPSFSTQS